MDSKTSLESERPSSNPNSLLPVSVSSVGTQSCFVFICILCGCCQATRGGVEIVETIWVINPHYLLFSPLQEKFANPLIKRAIIYSWLIVCLAAAVLLHVYLLWSITCVVLSDRGKTFHSDENWREQTSLGLGSKLTHCCFCPRTIGKRKSNDQV